MREIKVSQLYEELFTEHKSHDKVASIVLDVMTHGLCVMWDDAKRLKAMEVITNNYSKQEIK